MDVAALAGLCSLLAHGGSVASLPPGVACPAAIKAPAAPDRWSLRAAIGAPQARDAIARVTFAEAGNQGDSGLAAVVYTILNRLQDGLWGRDVDAVVNARGQFEPVMRAGGDWRRLPMVSAADQARIDTILNLVLDGRLPDLTNGARFFQNPQIVAARARAGQVSAGLVDFGSSPASAQIGAHRFYVHLAGGGTRGSRAATSALATQGRTGEDVLFVGGDGGASTAPAGDIRPAPARVQGDPAQALFVEADGRVRAARP